MCLHHADIKCIGHQEREGERERKTVCTELKINSTSVLAVTKEMKFIEETAGVCLELVNQGEKFKAMKTFRIVGPRKNISKAEAVISEVEAKLRKEKLRRIVKSPVPIKGVGDTIVKENQEHPHTKLSIEQMSTQRSHLPQI